MSLDGDLVDQKGDAESLTPTDDEDSASTSFVDFTGPPEAKVLPPAKYKLWLLVYVCVVCAIIVTGEAGYTDFLAFDGWLSPNTSFFLSFCTIVFVMAYGTLDLVVTTLTFQIGDEQYGLGPWMKAPRIQWIHRQNNFLAECLATIIKIFEEGFAMFDASNYANNNNNNNHNATSHHDPKVFDCKQGCKTDLKITHRIDPTKMKEYRRWQQKITAACKTLPGLVHVQRDSFMEYKTVDEDTNDVETGESNSASGDPQTANKKQEEEAFRYTVTLTFENVDYLNDWMMSPKRQAFMATVKPLLMAPDIIKIQRDRVLPDAFTDLLSRHGESVPSLPPKKWKVWWLTTLALFMTLKWSGTDSFMPYYSEQWGMSKSHPYSRIMVDALIITFMNSYVMIPLLMFLFHPWIQRKAGEVDLREPWRTLNDGVQQTWIKALMTFALYGGCIFAWMWRVHS